MINDYAFGLIQLAYELRNICFRNNYLNLNIIKDIEKYFKEFIKQLNDFSLDMEAYLNISRSLKELIIYADNGGDALDIFNYCNNVLLRKKVHPIKS